MKTMKKLASMALALVMLMALAVPAMAQDVGSGQGSITLKNATIGVEYTVYKLFDATYAAGANAEGGASYTIKKSATNSNWITALFAEDSPFALTLQTAVDGSVVATGNEGNDTVYNVTLKENYVESQLSDWLAGKLEVIPIAAATVEATEATINFRGLGEGYFLVKSTLNEGGTVTLTNAKPDATILDKNQIVDQSPEKGLVGDTDTYQIGETYGYKLTYEAVNYDGVEQITKYEFVDTPDAGVDVDISSIKVYVNDVEQTSGYTVTPATATGHVSTFTITIDWVDGTNASKYPNSSTIEVTYDAKLNDGAVIAGDGNKNRADFYYYVGNDRRGDKNSIVTVYTYALAIEKVNESGDHLAGATFVLKLNDATVMLSKVAGADNVYVVDPTGTVSSVTTDASGVIIIKGVSNVAYTLEETAAPNGYNKLAEPATVTPTADTSTMFVGADGLVDTEDDATGIQVEVKQIENLTGSLLPDTGGIGTTIFTVAGGALMVGAAILFITKKRSTNG